MRFLIPTLAVASVLPAAAEWYNDMQIGPAWSSTFDGTFAGEKKLAAIKGILVDLGGEEHALFDTETLRISSAYKGGVHWGGVAWTGEHGKAVRIANEDSAVFNTNNGPGWADESGSFDDKRPLKGLGNLEQAKYKGYYRFGSKIIFTYEVQGTKVLETIESTGGGFVTHFEIAAHDKELSFIVADDKDGFEGSGETAKSKGGLTVNVSGKGVTLAVVDGRLVGKIAPSKASTPFAVGYNAKSTAPFDFAAAMKGGEGIWKQEIVTKGTLSEEKGVPWVTDTITVPDENPWKANLRFGGFDFIDEDSAALCTWNGDVWVVKGLKGDLSKLTWRRFASGLFEPLGLKVVDGTIYVHGRDQITKLHDLNKDGEADYYETFFNGTYVTPNFHEFEFELQTDKAGNFYFAKASPVRPGGRGFDTLSPHNGIIGKVSKDGSKFEVVATGLRAPGGLGVSPSGEIAIGDNEGTWMPSCKVSYIKPDQTPVFLGVEPSRHDVTTPYFEPLCYLPMDVDNSSGSPLWVPPGVNWGLKEGELLAMSYGQSSIFRVLPSTVDGTLQGGAVRLPIKLRSSAMRGRFNKDGLYVCGFRGWQTNAANETGFQRIRYTGAPVTLPDKLDITKTGVRLHFEVPLDPELANDTTSYNGQRWNYVRGPQYGSGEFSVDNVDAEAEKRALDKESHEVKKRDTITIGGARLLKDGQTVEIDLTGNKPSMNLKVGWELEDTKKNPVEGNIYATVRKMGE
jgi:hypothetical protein